MTRTSARSMLACLESEPASLILLGSIDNDTTVDAVFVAEGGSLFQPEGLPPEVRAGAALVAAGSASGVENLKPLLARLRDVHADCVLVRVADALAPADALRALGFEARKSPSGDGLVYVWDPVLANRPREWNNSRHWANPENFSRYRW